MISNTEKFKTFFNYIKQKAKKVWKKLKSLPKRYPLTYQFLQLSFLYFYSTITLMYSVINCLGFCPIFIYKYLPFTKQLLELPFLKFLATPEKTFLLYLIAVRNVLKGKSTPILIKYHFVLVFMLEMLQNLLVSLWDLFSHRDMDISIEEMEFSLENSIKFFTIYFLFFFALYIYCYINSILRRFVSFPKPFEKITDSVAFWLQLKKDKKGKKK